MARESGQGPVQRHMERQDNEHREARYTGLVCRGSWALGTACGRCERCLETKPAPSEDTGDVEALIDNLLNAYADRELAWMTDQSHEDTEFDNAKSALLAALRSREGEKPSEGVPEVNALLEMALRLMDEHGYPTSASGFVALALDEIDPNEVFAPTEPTQVDVRAFVIMVGTADGGMQPIAVDFKDRWSADIDETREAYGAAEVVELGPLATRRAPEPLGYVVVGHVYGGGQWVTPYSAPDYDEAVTLRDKFTPDPNDHPGTRYTVEPVGGVPDSGVAEALKVLEWYADPISYAITQASEPKSAVHYDNGRRAKEALARLSTPEKEDDGGQCANC